MPEDLLTAQEAADFLKLKKTTVYEMIKRGEIPSAKIGKQLRINRADLEALLPGSGAHGVPARREQTEKPPLQHGSGHGSVVLCGQDGCLDLISNHVTGSQGNKAVVLRSHAGSYNSLTMLYHGKVDIATAILWHEKTGVYNRPYIEALLPGLRTVAVRLFGRVSGIYVAKGNPKGIRGLEDLQRRDIRLVNRERGSSARVFLDEKLRAMGIPAFEVAGYTNEQTTSLTVATAIARGEGDMGIGNETVKWQVPDVNFIPLQTEWCDMVFLAEREREPAFQAILNYVLSESFATDLSHSVGYDLTQTGKMFRY